MPWSACELNIKNVNNYGVVFAGQTLEGSFTIVFKKEKNVNYIKCRVIGTYKASWSRPMPTMPFIRIYSANKKVFEVVLELFSRDIKAVPSIVTKEFSFYIPEEIPSSFVGSLGKVEYRIELEAKGNNESRKKYIYPLTVYRKSLINDLETLLVSTEYFLTKKTLLNSKIDIMFQTLKGFSAPQIIPFDVVIVNEKTVKIKKIKVALVQLVRYYSNAGYADIEKHLTNVEEQIQSNSRHIAKHFSMELNTNIIVPTSNRNNLETEHFLDIKYEFHIEFVFPYHINLFEKIPVIVLST